MVDGVAHGGDAWHDAENRVYAQVIQLIDTLPDAAGKRHHRAIRRRLLDRTGHTHRRFAVLRLKVDASFAGEAIVRPCGQPRQSGRLDHQVNAGSHACFGEGQESRAKATGRTRTGHGLHLATQLLADHRSIMGQRVVQPLDHVGSRTFLRAEHGRCAAHAGQRIGHVRSQTDVHVGKPWIKTGDIHFREFGQRRTAKRQWRAVVVQQPYAQCLCHARPAIVRSRTSQSHDDVAYALLQRILDQFTGAVGGGDQRIARGLVDVLDAACRGHFDDRSAAVTENAVFRIRRMTERVGDQYAHDAPAGIHQRLNGAFAAIRHGDADAFGFGQHLENAGFDGLRRFSRGKGALE